MILVSVASFVVVHVSQCYLYAQRIVFYFFSYKFRCLGTVNVKM